MNRFFNIKLLALLVVALSLVMSVAAEDLTDSANGAEITSSTEGGSLSETAAGSDVAGGGNVTTLDLNTDASTVKWQGYVGEVEATLALGTGSNTLYSFGAVPNDQINSVFASLDSSFDFSSTQAVSTEISDGTLDSLWGFTNSDQDSIKTAFTGGDTATISGVANVPAVNLTTYTAAGALSTSPYQPGILADTASPSAMTDIAFGVSVSANQKDYSNSSTVDYQLMVPVNDSGSFTGQTYYFFLDLE